LQLQRTALRKSRNARFDLAGGHPAEAEQQGRRIGLAAEKEIGKRQQANPLLSSLLKELRLAGSKNASVLELRKVMGLVAEGRLKPIIHKAFPLAQAAEAHRVVDSRDFFGKVVLLP